MKSVVLVPILSRIKLMQGCIELHLVEEQTHVITNLSELCGVQMATSIYFDRQIQSENGIFMLISD